MWISKKELEALKDRVFRLESRLELEVSNFEEKTRIVLPGYVFGAAPTISIRDFVYSLIDYLKVDVIRISRRETIEIVKKPTE